jgi:Glycosyl transferase 4-like domain/Glycosyl transferases group 1
VSRRWNIITGEYPPQLGGVSDYTRLVACGLARVGDEVVVWVPPSDGPPPEDVGVEVRQLPGHFGPMALAELDAGLARRPGRVLVQYTPHAFGFKAMNLPLCAWLFARCRPLDVMFHEVAFPCVPGQPMRHKVLATVNRGMASLLLRGADRVMVSIPGWSPLLRRLAIRNRADIWIPTPSNLPTHFSEGDAREARRRLQIDPHRCLVGHFGTYGAAITQWLAPAIGDILAADPDVHLLLLGHGSSEFAVELKRKSVPGAERIQATGVLGAEAVATHIGACDVMLQPYPDGISSRRGSSIGPLALGRPIVTTSGELTEPLWAESGAVAIAAPRDLAPSVLALWGDAAHRAELGRRAAELYRTRFSLEFTIQALREIPASS